MKQQSAGYGINCNWLVISLFVVVTLTMLVLYMPALGTFDANLLKSVRLFLSPYPICIPTFVSSFGYANHLLWPQITLACVLLSHEKYLKAFLAVFFTQATFVSVSYVKEIICRERPSVLEGYSFPSMHSALTMCFYGIVIYFVLRNVHNKFLRYFLVTVFGLWIFLVIISRMWLNVHYPTDVIAGAFVGVFMLNLFIICVKFFNK